MNSKRVIAVAGKGGTGKTALVAIMVKILTRNRGSNVLAIDADSAVSLPYALGIEVEKKVSDLREEVIRDPEAKKRIATTHIGKAMRNLVKKVDGVNLLVMGRPEGPGCFCAVNDLLRYGIESVSKDYDITVIDCEAGPEQVNRRVTESVDMLVVLADTSTRSLRTANSIRQVAKSASGMSNGNIGLVVNRVKSAGQKTSEDVRQLDMRVLGFIPDDDRIAEYDLAGRALVTLPDDSPAVLAVEKILNEIGL